MDQYVRFPNDPNSMHVCQNCGSELPGYKVLPIADFSSRVAPGEPCPSGTCPDCLAVVHPRRKYVTCQIPKCRPLSTYVLAVAAPGVVGDWGVYIAPVPGQCHREEVLDVIQKGAKQPRSIGTALFPQFDPEKYRD